MDIFPPSLIKYENPHLITTYSDEFEIHEPKKLKDDRLSPDEMEELESEDEEESDIDESVELLDILLPPRQHEENCKLWIQRVSRAPATETDVLNLQDQLDKELSMRTAKEIGICPVRRELYSQCFDELIRQEIIVCPERGRLYKRIRVETQMTVDTLRRVYESNIAYGIKKILTKMKYDDDLKTKINVLVEEKSTLDEHLEELRKTLEETEKIIESELSEMSENYDTKEQEIKGENDFLMEDMKAFLDRDFLEYETEE